MNKYIQTNIAADFQNAIKFGGQNNEKKTVLKNIRSKINENHVKIFQNGKQNNKFYTAGLYRHFYGLFFSQIS